jgi:hypothetical protein
MTREVDIQHENGPFWVCRDTGAKAYIVFRPSKPGGYSESDSAYAMTPDGLSIAKARCDYLAKRAAA